jgi:hypothetical protein
MSDKKDYDSNPRTDVLLMGLELHKDLPRPRALMTDRGPTLAMIKATGEGLNKLADRPFTTQAEMEKALEVELAAYYPPFVLSFLQFLNTFPTKPDSMEFIRLDSDYYAVKVSFCNWVTAFFER